MLKFKRGESSCEVEVTISNEEWEQGVQQTYERTKGKYNVGGFRKGHAPRKFIEQTYGENVFFDDTIEYFVNKSLRDVMAEQPELEPLTEPSIEYQSFSPKDGLKFKITYVVLPEFEVGQYKGMTVKVLNPHMLTVEEHKQRLLKENATYTKVNRPAKLTDKVIIDFMGFMDGVQFDGGSAENYSLILGDKQFIDNFEEQIVGHSEGDKFTVNVTFPKDYGMEEFRNKPASFEVKLKEVDEVSLPEFTDKFVADTTEYESVDEYIKQTSAHIEDMRQKEIEKEFNVKVIKMIIANTKMPIPEKYMDTRKLDALHQLEEYASKLKVDKDTICSMYGYNNEKTYIEAYLKSMSYYFRSHYITQKIWKQENLKLSDEEIERVTHGITDENIIEENISKARMQVLYAFLKKHNKMELIDNPDELEFEEV